MGFLLNKTALCVSVLPYDLLGESGVKIGKVGEVGEKSVLGDKCECVGDVHTSPTLTILLHRRVVDGGVGCAWRAELQCIFIGVC